MGDAGAAIAASIPPRATSVAHAWVRADIYSELVYQAKLKRLHPDQLAGLLLTAALVLGRVDELIEEARMTLES